MQMLGQLILLYNHILFLQPYKVGNIISPVTQVRELRLKDNYGRQKNGFPKYVCILIS